MSDLARAYVEIRPTKHFARILRREVEKQARKEAAMAKFIATQKLYVGPPENPVLAHAPGDEVPEANIERNGWSDGVARQGTKAAEKATTEAVEGQESPATPDAKK